jgi:hypothetical protein
MPEDSGERRPKLKMNFVANPELLGVAAGFKGIEGAEKGPIANYVNKARIVLVETEPRKQLDAEGNMIRDPRMGGWFMFIVKDYDFGHEMALFFNERVIEDVTDKTKPKRYEIPYVLRDLFSHIKEQKITRENAFKYLFELGKVKGKSPQGKWYIKLVSTTADQPGLFDDPEAQKFKAVSFTINDAEKAIIAKINELVEKNGLPKNFTREMFVQTFVSGAVGGLTSTETRALQIWEDAKKSNDNIGLHTDVLSYIMKS